MEVSASACSPKMRAPSTSSTITPARTTDGDRPTSPMNAAVKTQAASAEARRPSLRDKSQYPMPLAADRCRPDTTSRWEMPASRKALSTSSEIWS